MLKNPCFFLKTSWDDILLHLFFLEAYDDAFEYQLTEEETKELSRISHPKRKREWVSTRMVYKSIFDDASIAIEKGADGKPKAKEGKFISISHSKTYACLGVGEANLGIDIQECDEKCEKLGPKFCTPKEVNQLFMEDPYSLLWSAKESVFKYFGTQLPFLDIHLVKAGGDQLEFKVNRLGEEYSFKVHYQEFENHFLCVARPLV